jgi:hypothetical protein
LTRDQELSVSRAVALCNDAFAILGEHIPKIAAAAYDKGTWAVISEKEAEREAADFPNRFVDHDPGPWLLCGRGDLGTNDKPRSRDKPDFIRDARQFLKVLDCGLVKGRVPLSLFDLAKRADGALTKEGVVSIVG